MGFFSWKTSDTKETIWNRYTNNCRGVYLLCPDGKHIYEPAYEGYGVFGGVDAHVWLAEHNLDTSGMSEEQKRNAGINLFCGDYYLEKETGIKWVYGSTMIDGSKSFKGNFETVQDEFSMTPNQAISSGLLEKRPIAELFDIKYPLKFSFNKKAKYDELPAAEDDDRQGYWDGSQEIF